MDSKADSMQQQQQQQNVVLSENTELLNNMPLTEVTDPAKKNTYTACHAVIDLPELLESIILFLPFKYQLRATRISKTFKAVIDDSVKIQQELFLLPVPYTGPPLEAVFKPDGSEDETHYLHVELNPILVGRLYLAGFTRTADCDLQSCWRDGDPSIVLWTSDTVCKERLDRQTVLSRMVLSRPAVPLEYAMVGVSGEHEEMDLVDEIYTVKEMKVAETEALGTWKGDVVGTEWKLCFPGGLRLAVDGERCC